MKKYFRKKRIFAAVFLLTVFTFSAFNFKHSFNSLKETVKENMGDLSTVTKLDNEMSQDLLGRMNFIETYAFVQKIMGKREFNNFSMIKDENGYLHYASFFREEDDQVFEYAMRVKRLKDYAETKGTKVLFVVTPSKYDRDKVKFKTGMPVNDPSNVVNELMFDLNRLGVSTLNLGETMPNNELPYESTFFKTDHHWTIPAAYYATGELANAIEEDFGESLTEKEYYTGPDAYESVTYKGGMLGSMGRKTGAVFSGVDDFTALWPNFEGNYLRESMTNDGKSVYTYGSFEQTFMNTDVLTEESDLYTGSQYALYLNELRIYEKIVNNENPNGCKMFMIRDSYFSPVISFMMPMCGEIDAMWSLEQSDQLDIESYIKENDFDYIIIEVYPYNINEQAFNYFKEE